MNTKPTKLLLVEDESVIALDLEQTLSRRNYEVLAIATSAPEAIALASRSSPDLVLMDINLSGSADGIEAAATIRERLGIPVVFLTAHVDSDTIRRASQTQPYGFISKPWNVTQLDTTLRIALDQHARFRAMSQERASETLPPSRHRLTSRQSEVIKLIADGKSNKEIAAALDISVKTVNFHKANLMDQLGLRTTAELTRFAVRHGLVSP